VRPTQGVKTFGNISSPFCTSFDLRAKFYGDSPGETHPSGALNARGVAKLSDDGPIEGYISYLCHIRVSHLLMSFLLDTEVHLQNVYVKVNY